MPDSALSKLDAYCPPWIRTSPRKVVFRFDRLEGSVFVFTKFRRDLLCRRNSAWIEPSPWRIGTGSRRFETEEVFVLSEQGRRRIPAPGVAFRQAGEINRLVTPTWHVLERG